MIFSIISRFGCSCGVLLLVLLTNTAFKGSDFSAYAQSSHLEVQPANDPPKDASGDNDFTSLTQLVLSGMVLSFGYGVLRQFQPPKE